MCRRLVPVLLIAALFATPDDQAAAALSADAGPAWREYMASHRDLPPGVDYPFRTCFLEASRRHRLPVSLLLAVARGESNFDPGAVSSANARGVMQILWPGTGRELGFRSADELHQPCPNIDAGARYLSELLKRYQGDLHLALAAYNYGPGRISADGADVPAGARWYSAYIYRHLQYVLGETQPVPAEQDWDGDRQLAFAYFRAPYRADAFVSAMQAADPTVRLDWFREDVARFSVVLLYASAAEKDAGITSLRRAGMAIEGG